MCEVNNEYARKSNRLQHGLECTALPAASNVSCHCVLSDRSRLFVRTGDVAVWRWVEVFKQAYTLSRVLGCYARLLRTRS
jgi:hypothetical protein